MKLLCELLDRSVAKEGLTEEIHEISHDGSDSAQEAYHAFLNAVYKSLKISMKVKGDENSTPGFLNVAALIAEKLSVEDLDTHHELSNLAVECFNKMTQERDAWKKVPNYNQVLKNLGKMVRNSGSIPS